MKTMLIYFGMAIALAGITTSETAFAASQRSPYSGIWHPTYASRMQRPYRYAYPCQYDIVDQCPEETGYSNVSYQTATKNEFAVGDRVVVSSDNAALMLNHEKIGTICQGTELTIQKVQGSWLEVSTDINGEHKSGWVASSNVTRRCEIH